MKTNQELIIEIKMHNLMVNKLQKIFYELNLQHIPFDELMSRMMLGSMFLLESKDERLVEIVSMDLYES